MMENRLAPFVEKKSWFKLSRFGGAMRYHFLRKRRLVLFLVLVMAAALAVDLGLAFFGTHTTRVMPVSADLPVSLLLVLCCSFPAAKHESTFLMRFGTPRTAVWLSNILSLFLSAAVFLVLSIAVNALGGIVGLLLAKSGNGVLVTETFHIGEYLQSGLQAAAADLPMQLLWLAEYTAIFYFLACCLRRWRIPTILVLVGVPALLFTTLLLPVFDEVGAVLEGGEQNQLVALLLRFMAWLEKAADFIAENWQTIQGVTAGVTLVLGYWVMRGTKQPE
jgi:hypothetical protein